MQSLSNANFHLKEFFTATFNFLSNHSPSSLIPFRTPRQHNDSLPIASSANYKYLTFPAQSTHPPSSPSSDSCLCSCHAAGSHNNQPSPHPMRRELDLTRTELNRSQAEVIKLQEKCRSLDKALKETREQLLLREAEIERLRRERNKERRRSEDLHAKSNREVQHSQSLTSIKSHLTNGDRPTPRRGSDESSRSTNSEEERARIRSSETYLTRTDSWSGAQVLQAVHDLNSEILQFTAAATELCTFDKDSRPPSSRSAQAMHEMTARLGSNLTHILSTRDHSQDPTLLQLALQGCISTCIVRALASFCIGYPSKSDAILSQLYSHMCLEEPQPTSSKWRSLTHQHIHNIYPTLGDYAVNDLTETIFRWTSDTFIIAGCSSYDSASPSSSNGLRSRFGDQVRRIAKSVTGLARVTREEIMSTCFEIVSADHTESFESRSMSDAFSDYVPSRGSILATTELGLRCTTRKGPGEMGKADEDVLIEQRMLLLPKVVLESVLDAFDTR